jgi:hypothetical protein
MEKDLQELPVSRGSAFLERLRGWRSSLRLMRRAVLAATLAVVLWVTGMPPIWPFLTTGHLYVEGPQIYTRERLVNDRYRQDAWLNARLEALDDEEHLIRGARLRQFFVGGEQETEKAGERMMVLPFQEDFLLRSAIRDKVRQMILENLLDDRHDLAGNSIYGLKFETAILPGSNTYARPFVLVHVDADLFEPPLRREERNAEKYLKDTALPPDAVPPVEPSPFIAVERPFESWKESLEARLNHYLDAARARGSCRAEGKNEAPERNSKIECERELIGKALQQVMGIDPHEMTGTIPGTQSRDLKENPFHTPPSVQLPEPWRRYFLLRRGEARESGDTTLKLSPIELNLALADEKAWLDYLAAVQAAGDAVQAAFLAVRGVSLPPPRKEEEPEESVPQNSQNGDGGGKRTHRFLSEGRKDTTNGDEPRWEVDKFERDYVAGLSQDEIKAIAASRSPETCLHPHDEKADSKSCQLRGRKFRINYSHYNFLKAILDSDSYSYAVFPRGDVEGILTDSSIAASSRWPGTGPEAPGLGALIRSQTARAERVVVNFANFEARHAKPTEFSDHKFDFGWAVVKPGRQEAMQVSQLVLVSVPAYITKLKLVVKTGWLDRHSNPIWEGEETTMKVALPPDYEALDTLVIGGSRYHGPVIDETRFSQEIRVDACDNASILIPGERLWRSTTVTLGGQTADRITVMPDMGGIIASFEGVQMLPASGTDKDMIDEQDLTVWTSEGSAKLRQPVKIRRVDDAQSCKR